MRILQLAIAAVLAISLHPSLAHAECVFWRAFTEHVAAFKADLRTDFRDCAEPLQTWFEWSTRADLADPLRIRAVYQQYDSPGSRTAKLEWLAPDTTYYFQPRALFADRTTLSGPIESLKTLRNRLPLPECRYRGQESKRYADLKSPYAGRDGIFLDFECNGRGFGGAMHFRISRTPDMADSRLMATDALFERDVPLFFPSGVFFPYDEFADGMTLYVQAEIENNLGTSRSEIVTVTLKRPR